jgi:NOL1/NOP2/fmu family ribosome biogenesis protein
VFPAVRTVAEALSAIYSGVEMGQLFHGKLRPEHSLALFHDLAQGIVPEAALELTDALQYLRKNDSGVELFTEGMNLVSYEGFPIGWLKRIGHRVNNMYPKELRIMNL